MVKKIFARLSVLILVLSISGCSVLFPEPQIITIRHVSNLTLHNSFLYFGAGYCLYELNVRNQDLREILCKDEWLFQRPAIDETRAYAQVMNSITGKRYFVAVELQSGALVWQVQEKSRQPYFPGLRQDTFLMGNMVVTARRDGIDVFGVDTGKRIWDLSDNYMDAYSYQFQDGLIWYTVQKNKGDTSEDGVLIAVDPKTGEIRERISFLPEMPITVIAYIDDHIVVGFARGKGIVAINRLQPDEFLWMSSRFGGDSVTSSGLLFNSEVISDEVRALDMNSGEVIWLFNPESEYEYSPVNDPEQIIIVSDTIFLGDHNHSETMYALDSSSGNPIWEYTPPILDGSALINDYVVAENSVYLTTDDKVTALDLLTGELLWQVELDNEIEYASSEAD